jgi:hypothetical protein
MQTTMMRYGTSELQRVGNHPRYPDDTATFIKRFAPRGRDPAMADENLYRYCGDEPVVYVDPSGLREVTILGAPEITGTNTYDVKNWGTVVVTLETGGGKLPERFHGMRGVYIRLDRAKNLPTDVMVGWIQHVVSLELRQDKQGNKRYVIVDPRYDNQGQERSDPTKLIQPIDGKEPVWYGGPASPTNPGPAGHTSKTPLPVRRQLLFPFSDN